LKNIGLVEKEFNAFELDAVGASSVVYSHGVKSEVIPDEFQSLRDISPGDTLVGNTFWEVKSSEVGSLVIYDHLVEPHIFFLLKPQ
jgi:hypothetical protein